ncbi:RNA polymerase factor sigma-32 [Bacteriovoracaceae bacterium]|nr:RNA polymerase factor sigma-32 [Bacteriovoracaceae bacterium]|tara:strand:+ start:335641 stop:336708 length:1068 start_codon:yes stop_codon:yes gene_type:complete
MADDKKKKSIDPEIMERELKENLEKRIPEIIEILPSNTSKEDKAQFEKDVVDVIQSVLTNEGKELIEVKTSKDVVVHDSGKPDQFRTYLREISRYELLSEEQEKALTNALAETGDIEVAKKLVLHNLRLVVKIAMEYRSTWQNVMDLIQEGNIGLMKAVSKYDPDKGAKLSYYASWWIRSYVLKFILDNFRLVKVGTTNEQKKIFYNLMKEKNRLLSQGLEADSKTLSENLGVSEKTLVSMDSRLTSGGEVSIDASLDSDDGAAKFSDFLKDSSPSVEEQVADAQSIGLLNEHLQDFVSNLKERDREIFKKRLLSEVPPSLQAIANDYGVSRERIRQIEERLLNNLKVYMSEHIR